MVREVILDGSIMVSTLAFLGVMTAAVAVNNQTDKIDCYERQASGQRLHASDVYKTIKVTVLQDCQIACTEENETCRSFSYGVGLKGNASCEMSSKIVKETADYKPIGTVNDTDYDLYIKKIGCKLVLEKYKDRPVTEQTRFKNQNQNPSPIQHDQPGVNDFYGQSQDGPYHNEYQDDDRPSGYDYKRPAYGFMYAPNFYGPPMKVQSSLISISPIPGNGNGFDGNTNGFDRNSNRFDGNNNYYSGSNKNYVSHSYSHYGTGSAMYDQQDNSLDFGRPSGADRLPYPFSSNYGKPPPLYVEENNYEESKNHFLAVSYGDRHPPFGNQNSGRYPPKIGYLPPKYNYGGQPQPEYPDVEYNRLHNGYSPGFDDRLSAYPNNEYHATGGDSNFVKYNDRGHGLFTPNQQIGYNEFHRPHDRPNYRPENFGPYPDRAPPPDAFDYHYPQDYSEFTYGGHYSNYKHTPTISINETDYRTPSGNRTDDARNTTTTPNAETNATTLLPSRNGQIVSQTTGPNGETITSIITELEPAVCFRRALTGKRVTHYITRTLTCETLDDCRQECATEKGFVCEGFNYRFTRGQGTCELLDRPLSVMDSRRCVAYDPETDYYERDRNGDSGGCKTRRPPSNYPPSGSGSGGYSPHYGSYGDRGYYDYNSNRGDNRRYDYYGGGAGGYYDSYGGTGGDYYQNDYYYGSKPSCKGCRDKNYGYDYRKPDSYDDRRPSGGGSAYDDRYRPYPSGDSNKYGDFSYHQSHHHSQNSQSHQYHFTDRDDYDRRPHYQHRHQPEPYLPKRRPPQYDFKSYEPYLPPDRKYGRWPYYDGSKYNRDRERDRNYWGFNRKGYTWGSYGRPEVPYYDYGYRNNNRYDYDGRKNYYLPAKVDDSRNWGVYGGSYGTGGQSYYNQQNRYDYWGLDKPTNSGYYSNNDISKYYNYGELPPREGPAGAYLPVNGYDDHTRRIFHNTAQNGVNSNSLDTFGQKYPVYSTRPGGYNFIKEECSLRAAAGFKLRRPIVKKILSVPNIYECEAFCFAEKETRCASYAYRYTFSASLPSENCFLSNKDFKQLDYYIDLEPDKDFDIYTMNNLARCDQPLINRKVESECFWRVRSSYRLDSSIVRDSLNVNSIVECQIQCLKSYKFTCRAFSFRYGSRIIGSATDNCQLTDWPYHELNHRTQLVPERGFELYERGSFGYGCEPDHFGIKTKPQKVPPPEPNQLCYVGFGSPAKLLPQATRKSLFADTELECKTACSRSREETLLQCMSFSYRAKAPKGTANCDLTDVMQRDLLAGIDYVGDPDAWLFSWDDLNPDCAISGSTVSDTNRQGEKEDIKEGRYGLGIFRPLDTWRVYSVNGWPCRRGCRQNKDAGFWFCELEGEENLWDYCCRPDHSCGHSQGFPYKWCYVGPERSQWRKCSEKYYPYFISNRHASYEDQRRPYLPVNSNLYLNDFPLPEGSNAVAELKPPYRPGARPDRPSAPPRAPFEQQPSLDQYEQQFESEFLEPPKPGGFGPSRHWPVMYLHKDMPISLNSTSQFEHNKDETNDGSNPKLAAIQNLIDIIKSNDLKNVKYQISNDSSKSDDVLFVKIPLPANFSQETGTEKAAKLDSEFSVLIPDSAKASPNIQTSTIANLTVFSSKSESSKIVPSSRGRNLPVYRRSYVERTNVTSHGRQSRNYNERLH